MAGKEEDIMGDFPSRLHYLKHTHLGFLRLPHKGLVYPETAQEVRSDVGKSVMVDSGYSSLCGVGWLQDSLEKKRPCSRSALAPTKPDWAVTGDGEDNGSSHLPLQPNDVSHRADRATDVQQSPRFKSHDPD